MTTILRLEAKQDHLAQIATSRDPIKALAEFVWNALDADAKTVRVEFPRNALGGMNAIRIVDDGSGINEAHATGDFRDLGDSWKRNVSKTSEFKRAMHGKEGRGRLRFYSLADRAEWKTTYKSPTGMLDLTIEIEAAALATSRVSDPTPSPNSQTGTIVELTAIKPSLEWLRSDLARQELTTIFAPTFSSIRT